VSDRTRGIVGAFLGIVVVVAVWAVAARGQPELILPSPAQTWAALTDLATDGTIASELVTTLRRAVVGVAIALVIGVAWGAANGWSRWAAATTQPVLAALMAIPPVVMVAVGMVWFGPGDAVARLVIAIVALPLIVLAVQEAIQNLDRDLLEMASVFELPRRVVLRHIVAPGVTSPVVAALSVTFGQALRVTVMVELLAASTGVGAEVARSRANLMTADLFAWALLMILVVLVIELAVLRPTTARLLRWRTASTGTSAIRVGGRATGPPVRSGEPAAGETGRHAGVR